MAIDLTLKSPTITNRDSTPTVLNSPSAGTAGRMRVVFGYLASVTASLSSTSVIRLCSVPSAARVTRVVVNSGAQTLGTFNIGVYRNTRDGGAVAVAGSDAFFTANLNCAAAVVDQEVTHLATTLNTIAKSGQPLWQAVGMASDPNAELDICATVGTTAVTTGTGAISVQVEYTY